ncbi:MAG: beta-ketoacyl-ACP synthase III [Flavobacteriaceae bacterium]|jgi:3-oxoacyl-[acyl-carrier-protein] synthase-3
MFTSRITGLGKFLPERIVTNEELSGLMDTSHDWIVERTGIHERRFVPKDSDEGTASMGVKAAEQAIARAGISKDDIDLIVFATLSPDYYFPGSGVLLQDLMGIGTCPALDVRNQCSGFVYSLSVADQFIKTGMYKNVLVVGSEYHSGGLDLTTRGRTVSVIFGDGAGAAVVSRSNDSDKGILSTHLHSEGKHAKELSIIGPSTKKWIHEVFEDYDPNDMDYHPYMNGQLVFKNAVVRFSEVINKALEANGLGPSDIDMLVPHQANLRIAQFVQKKFGLSNDQVYNNIMRYGNTTAASIPIALCEAWEEGKIKDGDHVMLAAFGSGFTWGSAMIRW